MNNIHIPPVVKNLLIINVLFFAATELLASSMDLGRVLGVYYFDSPYFRVWQLITYMFMHGGWGHIFFQHVCVIHVWRRFGKQMGC
jgi:membrane associated rhomboid family serine protease